MPKEIKSPLRPQLLGRMTQRAVVEALKANGPMSRADLARLTGISPTTVSSAVVQVMKAGFVEECDAEISGPGRPGKILRLARDRVQVIGASVEPEWCEILVGGLDGLPIENKSVRFPTPNTYSRLMAEIERYGRRWLDTPKVRTLGLGLALPGLINPSGDVAVFSPNVRQTDGQRPGRDLADRFGIPTILIQENDALVLGERRAHNATDLAVLDYKGGLGCGGMTNGRLFNRHLGLPTELGHVTAVPGGIQCACGNQGCLETVATDAAFGRLVSQKLKQSLTVDEAFTAVTEARLDARPMLETVVDYLAVAASAIGNLYAPPLIVLHGRLLDLDPELMRRLETKTRARLLAPLRGRCRLVKSKSSKAAGALAGILDHLFEELGPLLAPGGV